ncbi:MAG: hypothetical protein JNM94_01435 [Phycisphaerae bacterium]|nr:hypothetical protein [Phycisphaerae bacterium]
MDVHKHDVMTSNGAKFNEAVTVVFISRVICTYVNHGESTDRLGGLVKVGLEIRLHAPHVKVDLDLTVPHDDSDHSKCREGDCDHKPTAAENPGVLALHGLDRLTTMSYAARTCGRRVSVGANVPTCVSA